MATKMQYFIYGVITASILALSFFTITSLYADWSEPPTNPPGGNVDVPVNTGSVSQDKNGGFGANVIAAYDKFNFVFKNTSSDSWPAWRLVRNDGTGNFHVYINSEGGNNPTFETEGHAFHEKYNPGNGVYEFSTSNGSDSAGSAISWQNAFKIFPDGRVGADQYCDINGGNCQNLSGGGGGGGTVIPGWPDAIRCTRTREGWFGAEVQGRVYFPDYTPGTNGLYYYRTPGSGDAYITLRFNPDGSFKDETAGVTDCAGKSIAELGSEGKAFSFGAVPFTSGGNGVYHSSRGEVGAVVRNETGLGAPGHAVYSTPESRAAVCEIALPGSSVQSYTNHSWDSPGDNYVYLYRNDGTWGTPVAGSAYNRVVQTLHCQ